MIKKLLIIIFPLSAFFALSSSMMSEDGRAGRTGSPGELTCVNTCHNSFALNSGGGSITIQSPGTPTFAYTPLQTYNMSVTVAKTGVSLFGVGIEALTTANDNAGTLNITDAAATQIKSAMVGSVLRRNIVHQQNGGASANSKVFNFSWTAPAAGTGNVTFYFAGVAANGNGMNSQDYVYNSSQVFTEDCAGLPSQPGSINGSASVCSGSSQTYSIAAVAGATSYTWTLPSGWTGTSTTTSINTTAGTAGNISVVANNTCGSSTATLLSITTNSTPATPGAMLGTIDPCIGSVNTYSIGPVTGATSYTWTLPSGWTGTSTTTSILATTGNSSGAITVTANNGCGSSLPRTLTINVITIPSNPFTMIGNPIVCSGSSQIYSIPLVPGATNYIWTLPGSWSGTSTTNSITVTVGSSGVIAVQPNNQCGNSITNSSISVLVTSGSPSTPGPITGNSNVCGGTSQTYSIAPISGATSYTWTLPSGWTGTSTVDSIVATPAGNSGLITVTANNTCGSSLISSLNITAGASPVQPGIITGSNSVCIGTSQHYSIVPVSGAISYTWMIPSGWTGTSTLDSIALIAGSSGDINVIANNACGSSSPSILTVASDSIPPQPSSITGDSTVCIGASVLYSVSPVAGAIQYNWTLPSGWTGISTVDSINVVAGNAGGNIEVSVANGCGTGSPTMLALAVNQLPTPVINFLPSVIDTLFTTAAVSYQWYVDGNIISGETDSIHIPTQNGNYTVEVTDSNGCSGMSSMFNYTTLGIRNNELENGITFFPNPASDKLLVKSAGLFGEEFTLLNLTGEIIFETNIFNEDLTIDTSQFSEGVYFAIVGTIVNRVVILRK